MSIYRFDSLFQVTAILTQGPGKMSRGLLHLRGLQQSISRKLLKILHSQGKTFWHLSPPQQQQLCSFCCLQHHRLLSTKHTPLHTAKTVNAADPVKQENQPLSGPKTEVDAAGSSAKQQPDAWVTEFRQPVPQLNWDYLCNPNNRDIIRNNVANRKGVGDVDRVVRWVNVRTMKLKKEYLWQV